MDGPLCYFKAIFQILNVQKRYTNNAIFKSVLLFWIFDCEVLLAQGIRIKLNILILTFQSVKEIGKLLHKLKYILAMK